MPARIRIKNWYHHTITTSIRNDHTSLVTNIKHGICKVIINEANSGDGDGDGDGYGDTYIEGVFDERTVSEPSQPHSDVTRLDIEPSCQRPTLTSVC